MGLVVFNALPDDQAREALLACCRAAHWADELTAGRPYRSLAALQARAAATLTDADVTEALAGHPRIGQAPTAGHSSFSRAEQSGVASADDQVRAELAAGNQAYEARFGHIYLVCASGRSARELLGILRERLGHDPDTERAVVRAELIKINDLRLAKLTGEVVETAEVAGAFEAGGVAGTVAQTGEASEVSGTGEASGVSGAGEGDK